MFRLIRNPSYLQYSPILLGFTFTFSVYLGLALLSIFNQNLSNTLWFLGIPLLAGGAILQFVSRRVLWIRTYQLFIGLVNVCVWSNLLWLILVQNQMETNRWFTGLIIGIILIGSILSVYWRNVNSDYLLSMPYGSQGILNSKTGIVDLTRTHTSIQKGHKRAERSLNTVWRLSPLIAGLAMFLVRVLSESTNTIILAFITLIWIILCASGVGGAIAYVVCILRWEREHNKPLYIRR